jgi:hypothetical protein
VGLLLAPCLILPAPYQLIIGSQRFPADGLPRMVSILKLLVQVLYEGVYLPHRKPNIKAFPTNRLCHNHLLLPVVNIELTAKRNMSSTFVNFRLREYSGE